MDRQDHELKQALQSMQSSIPDPYFTQKLVRMHLEKAEKKSLVLPIDFGSIIVGFIAVICALAVSFANTMYGLGLSDDHLTVLHILPVIFLFFQLMNEFFKKGRGVREKLSTAT